MSVPLLCLVNKPASDVSTSVCMELPLSEASSSLGLFSLEILVTLLVASMSSLKENFCPSVVFTGLGDDFKGDLAGLEWLDEDAGDPKLLEYRSECWCAGEAGTGTGAAALTGLGDDDFSLLRKSSLA